ncbi:MAG TPA: hypothetical protein VJR89_18865, partial [Polyangiales bacterium]|nr:hypothetical protein [Polyangiales bacterium]
ATVLHLMAPGLGIGWLFWLEVAGGTLLWLALNAPPLLRPLLPATRAELRVAQRARLEFLDNRVYDTRDRTGVLIFLSELEHQVVILGDAGIYERLKAEGFAAYVERVIAAIRAGRAADGVCEVIADLGKQLAQQFPPRADDQNELPNAVREPDRL